MDSLIRRWDAEIDDDLIFCDVHGVAYQKDMRLHRVKYDDAYFKKYQAYEGTDTERKLNDGRIGMLSRHALIGATVLDIGIGSGAFIKDALDAGFSVYGNDINPVAVEHLKKTNRYTDNAAGFQAVTMWDSIEHMEEPQHMLDSIDKGALLLVATPIYDDLHRVRESKHYRPGEHLYYWTDAGFIEYMALRGFRFIERGTHEVDAGREAIGAYAFIKDLPGYRDHIELYDQLHFSRHYGSSATELHLATVAKVVQVLKPASILDYGCGRSDLVAHFWLDGKRRLGRYDPAIPAFKRMPEGQFDLVFCCDVMEHIPMAYVDKVLGQIRNCGDKALFTISLKLARAKLPDGRNAHVTLLNRKEWKRWIGDVFGSANFLPSNSEDEIVVLAGCTPDEFRGLNV